MDPENFVYYKKGDKVLSMGYEVDCKLLNKNLPAVDGSINGLAVPSGLFLLKKSIHSNTKNPKDLIETIQLKEDDSEVVNDDLYDTLLELMNPKKSKKSIKKQVRKVTKRKTRKKSKNIKSKRKTRTKRN